MALVSTNNSPFQPISIGRVPRDQAYIYWLWFELGSLHSATSDVIINSSRLSATPPSWVGSAVSNSVVSGRRADTSCGRVWFGFFFGYKKILGRTETRTRDRMYLGRIRPVRDISRGERARIATCRLRTPTDLRQIIV